MEVELNKVILFAVGDDKQKQTIVLNKAKEYIRKIEMKIPQQKKNILLYRNIIAVDFACRILEISYDYNKLISLITINHKNYQDSFIYCKNLLDIKWNVPAAIELLAIHFGQQFKSSALKIYDEYYDKYVSKQLKTIQDGINNSASSYQAASFYIAAKDMNINLDKSKIIQIAEVDSTLFRNCVESINNVLGKTKSSTNNDIMSKSKNRQILQLQQNQNNNNQCRQQHDNKTAIPNVRLKAFNQENLQPLELNNFEKIDDGIMKPILSNLKFEKVEKSEVINKQLRALGIVPSAELELKKKEAEDDELARVRELEKTQEQYLAIKRETLAKRRKLGNDINT